MLRIWLQKERPRTAACPGSLWRSENAPGCWRQRPAKLDFKSFHLLVLKVLLLSPKVMFFYILIQWICTKRAEIRGTLASLALLQNQFSRGCDPLHYQDHPKKGFSSREKLQWALDMAVGPIPGTPMNTRSTCLKDKTAQGGPLIPKKLPEVGFDPLCNIPNTVSDDFASPYRWFQLFHKP